MSLVRLPLHQLAWAEYEEILFFLSVRELWVFGCCCRSAFVTFLREKALRDGLKRGNVKLPRFLCKYSLHEKILLASYPRSGNSFMRKVLERETGIVTGSDSRPNRTLSASLLKYGYAGEGVTDQSVWIVKSHFPERLGYVKFSVKKVVLLVRNPFDAIQSYFHMGMTNTHDKNLTKGAFSSLQSIWKEFIVNEAMVWVDFHKYWLEHIKNGKVLVLRYEDLLESENDVVHRTLQFLLADAHPLGLRRYLRDSKAAAPGYKTRNKTIGKALEVLTVQEALQIAQVTAPLMAIFGYRLTKSETVPSAFSSSFLSSSAHPPVDEGINSQQAAACFRLDVLPISAEVATPAATPLGSLESIVVNAGLAVRSEDDKFGRHITKLRQSLTQNDKVPFPVN